HVDLTFRRDSGGGIGAPVLQMSRDETVRVNNIRETQRRDESVVFQEFVAVRPGAYSVGVVVRDGNSPAVAEATVLDTVPPFGGRKLRPAADSAALFLGAGSRGQAARGAARTAGRRLARAVPPQ